MKILMQDVRVLSTGLVRRAGKSVGKSEVPPKLWDRWIEEGILVDFDQEKLVRAPKPQVEPLKSAIESDLEKGEIVDDLPYSNLTLKRLREEAKEHDIERYWLKKKDTLVEELNALRG